MEAFFPGSRDDLDLDSDTSEKSSCQGNRVCLESWFPLLPSNSNPGPLEQVA